PCFVGRFEMTAQPLVQFGAVTLNPAPDGGVIRLQTALGEQFFDIAQRERVAKIPAYGAQNQLRVRLPPLEDCRSGCVVHGLCRLTANPAKVATHPSGLLLSIIANESEPIALSPVVQGRQELPPFQPWSRQINRSFSVLSMPRKDPLCA